MLTLEKLRSMDPGVFDSGVIPNSPEGVYMTFLNQGKELRWVASRGGIHDWAIYIHWAENPIDWVKDYGDKVTDVNHIKKLVDCDEEALKMYRL
jgi:hypothetical protein